MHKIHVNRLLYILLHEDTTLLRFFFGIASLMVAWWIGTDEDWKYFHETSLKIASQPVFALIFSVSGAALVYGAVTSHFNRWLLTLEGGLGVFAWIGLAWADSVDHGHITPITAGAIMAFLLLVRYPTHYNYPPKDTDHAAE